MRIVIEARSMGTLASKEEKWYLAALLEQLVLSHPEHFFILLTEAEPFFTGTNCRYMVVQPVKTYTSLMWWYSRKLPALLQQLQADRLITINGCAAEPGVRQVVFISSAAAALQAKGKSVVSLLYLRYLRAQLRKTGAIATVTSALQYQLETSLRLKEKPVLPVGYAVPPFFRPVTWQQREVILQNESGGREYFLFTGGFSETDILLVLKAFSLFKKRQRSSLQLIITGQFISEKFLREKLATYKYRADVVLHPGATEQKTAMLMAGAYAILFTGGTVPVAFPVAAAMQCGIPVIGLQANTATREAAHEAALYAEATPESLSEQMKKIYTNENLRQQLVAAAQERSPLVSGADAAQKLWYYLEKITAEIPPTFTA